MSTLSWFEICYRKDSISKWLSPPNTRHPSHIGRSEVDSLQQPLYEIKKLVPSAPQSPRLTFTMEKLEAGGIDRLVLRGICRIGAKVSCGHLGVNWLVDGGWRDLGTQAISQRFSVAVLGLSEFLPANAGKECEPE